jgi:hypothetical protein
MAARSLDRPEMRFFTSDRRRPNVLTGFQLIMCGNKNCRMKGTDQSLIKVVIRLSLEMTTDKPCYNSYKFFKV